MSNINFSEKLFELRKVKGLSQEELAEKVDVSRQTVSKWEMGQSTPEMEKLIALSELFFFLSNLELLFFNFGVFLILLFLLH